MTVKFRLLGSIEVLDGDRRVDVGHARQRAVLTVLLLDAGRVVPTATLLDRVWGNEPPDSAVNVLYTYIARLRKALAPSQVRLASRSGGYLIDIEEDAVDVHRFQRLVAAAEAEQDWDRKTQTLDEALGVWRGPPFAEVASPWLAKYRQTLVDQHLSALIDRNEAYLAGGRHVELVRPLRELVAEHPVDERPVAQLMLALYRSGRPSEALHEYQLASRRMVDQLGTGPSRYLRGVQQRILRDDPSLDQAPTTAAAALPTPAGLPHDVPGFVGRDAELARLDALVPTMGNPSRTVVVSAVDGTAGVGKTALAVHWAHRVKSRFPDGNLYADLRGYGPAAPTDPGQALDGFLAALDVSPAKIPPDVDAKAALYRTLLAERRVLVILDNAASPSQVRPLLPGTSTCLVVVTSRSMLTGLAARDRACRVSLDVLPLDDAVALLTGFVGVARVAADPDAARELAQLCAQLPVALCVAGERAAALPSTELAKLVAQLRAAASRKLDLLEADGDPDTAVRNVFSWSYQTLPDPAARLFRLLGLNPGHDIDIHGTAVLANTTLGEAQQLIDVLVRAHLVAQHGPGRYRMHDLLRIYAAEQAASADSELDRRTSLTRMFTGYRSAAATAMDLLFPHERHRRPDVPAASPLRALSDPTQAKAWLDTERLNLTAMTSYCANHGWPEHTTHLAGILWRYLDTGAHYTEALAIHGDALRAARDGADLAAEASTLGSLGTIHWRLGRYDEASRHYNQAVAIYHDIRDRAGEGRTLGSLGVVNWLRGRYPEALDHYHRALAIFREVDDNAGVAITMGNLGIVYWRLGRYADAADSYQQALVARRELGDRTGEGGTLGNLGVVYQRWGRYAEALDLYQQALALAREVGDRAGEGIALGALGTVHQQTDRYEEALDYHLQALAIHREIGNRAWQAETLGDLGVLYAAWGRHSEAVENYQLALSIAGEIGDRCREANVLNGLGETARTTGSADEATNHHRSALALAVAIGDRNEQARALDGLAHVLHATGHVQDARCHWQDALTIYADLDVPEADQVRRRLASLDGPDSEPGSAVLDFLDQA
jgi:tetratricopeptide (TPR) repeat protein